MKSQTIEYAYANPRAGTPEGGYNVYEHDEYPGDSVLAGQPRRSFLDHFDTQEEAKAAYPKADKIEGSSYREAYIPKVAPPWFDESFAGERWDEDY